MLGWPETTENIAADWGLLGKNGQLVLRVVALEAESCGNPMDVTELTGGWDQPRATNHQREDIAYVLVVSVLCFFLRNI